MEKLLLSVIIPVYNSQLTIRQCVDSILNQQFRSYEIILINDGSTDDSKNICEEYACADKRIKVINQNNKGVSAARNAGLDICRGKYVTFIDSDDYLAPNSFNEIDKFIEDIVFFDFISLWKGKFVKNVPIETKDLTLNYFIEKYCNTPYIKGPCAKFIKRELISQKRFKESMIIGEDTCFMFSLLQECKSINLSYNGEYVVRCPQERLDKKYAITVSYAISSLSEIFNCFKNLVGKKGISKSLFLENIQFFKLISRGDDRKYLFSKWYSSPLVMSMYKYVWPDLSFKQKIRLLGAFILRR